MTPQTPAQFGICSWSMHPGTPEELVTGLKDLGLKKVQLHLNPLADNPAVWGKTQTLLAQHGLTVVSGMFGTKGENYSTLETIRQTGGMVPDQHWPENWKIAQAVARVAGDMGLKLVSMHAGFLPDDAQSPDFAKLRDRIGQVADAFARVGVTLMFETGQENAATLEQFLAALQAQGHPNVGVNFDPANMILYAKGDPIAALQRLLPRVKQVHIKDANQTKTPGTWGTEMAIGQGQVDWHGFLRTLAAGDYQGDLVIEREAGPDRRGDVRLAITTLSKLMTETA